MPESTAPKTALHPAYGLGTVITFDASTGIAHVRFDNPPGMHITPRSLLPVAEMRLVNGGFVPVYAVGGA